MTKRHRTIDEFITDERARINRTAEAESARGVFAPTHHAETGILDRLARWARHEEAAAAKTATPIANLDEAGKDALIAEMRTALDAIYWGYEAGLGHGHNEVDNMAYVAREIRKARPLLKRLGVVR